MAKSHSYPKWSIAAIAGGVCLTAIEVYGAVGYLVGQSQPSYLVAGGAVITIVAAILPILAGRCWRSRRWFLAILLWMAMVPAMSLIVGAAVERTGGARDQANADRQAIALRIELTRTAEKEAKAAADAAEAKAVSECSRVANSKANPRGPLCKAAEERSDAKAKALTKAREDVAKAGVTPRDPQAARFAAILPGVTEEGVALYYPLILPLAISITGLLLITVGAHQQKPRKVQKRRAKRKKRRPSPPKPSVRSGNVVPLRKRA